MVSNCQHKMWQIWNSELKQSEWNFAHQFRQVWNRKKIRNGVSRVRSHRQRRTGRLLRERGTIACSQFEREHLSALTMPGGKNQGRKRRSKPKRGKATNTHAVVVGRQEKGAGSDLGAVFSSLLLGSWLGQSPPLLPLPQDHFVLSPLLPCQCSYVCIKWTNHRVGTNVWLCWKVQKTLINGDAIKLNQKSILMLYTLTVLFVAISQHICRGTFSHVRWGTQSLKSMQYPLAQVSGL